ncbi:hypothetical protein X797_011773 [Metarhizium robertsii]|uniref:Uncharacterized protein n=2 Tax=Metarhizium robertsii TaxID=568076 RepID=A0A014QR22_9HYPO|nr:hypothetical protein X797_011773 [Metarhizium robertsii]
MSTPGWQAILKEIQYHILSNTSGRKAPGGFDASLRQVCSTTVAESRERRFMEHSLSAWVALLYNESMRQSFNGLSSDDEKSLLDAVKDTSVSTETQQLIKNIFNRGKRAKSRQDYLTATNLAHLIDIDYEHSNGRKRQHVDEDQVESSPAAMRQRTEGPELRDGISTTSPARGLNDPASANSTEAREQLRPSSPAHVNFFPWTWPLGELLTDPNTLYLEDVFVPRMCDLIVKTNGYASVTIHHAPNAADSSLTIEIYRRFIPYLAAKVFSLTMVDRQPGWTALSGNGDGPDIEVDGENSYTIRRAREADIREYIGEPIYSIAGSGSRPPVDSARRFTRLLTLTLSGVANSNGFLKLQALPDKLYTIQVKLWPELRMFFQEAGSYGSI